MDNLKMEALRIASRNTNKTADQILNDADKIYKWLFSKKTNGLNSSITIKEFLKRRGVNVFEIVGDTDCENLILSNINNIHYIINKKHLIKLPYDTDI